MRVIACVNQKGGVGKTTICANLAYALSEREAKVLVLDMDPQGHLGQSFGFYQNKKPGIDQVLHKTKTLPDVTLALSDYLSFIPSGPGLQRLESVTMGKGRGLIIKKAMRDQLSGYDYVLMDCPPSSGFLVVNALAAAKELLIPVTPDYFGMSGLSHLLGNTKSFEKMLGEYERKWIVVSRMQARRLSDEVIAKLSHYFGDQIIPVRVMERAVLAECPSHGKPVLAYAPNSTSSKDFVKMAEIIANNGE